MNTGVLDKTRCYLVGHMQYADPGDWREVVKEALKDTNIKFIKLKSDQTIELNGLIKINDQSI